MLNRVADLSVIKYDDKNNPIEVIDKNGLRKVYLWGYDKERLVAVISNVSYDQIIQLLPNLDTILTNKTFDPSAIDALRSKLQNAEITTYTYIRDGLMETSRDPRGMSTKYVYDNQGRLSTVKDDKGNPLFKYDYQYRNR